MSIIWAGNVACMRKMGNAYNTLFEKPEGKRRDERITIKYILSKQSGCLRIGFI
jgi:hypothetical protein